MTTQAIVRDIKLVSDRERSELLETVRRALMGWSADHLPAAVTWAPSCDDASSMTAESGGWFAHGVKEVTAWSRWSARGRQQLAARMVQRSLSLPALPDSDWALQVADQAWNALNDQMLGPVCHACDHSDAEPDAGPWSGVVFISEPNLGAQWAWRLPTQAKPLPNQATKSVLNCLAHRSVRLQADLGEVDINLAELLALQVGDVVRFPVQSSQGVPFKLGDASRMAGRGQLGQIDGRLALRLSSSTSSRS